MVVGEPKIALMALVYDPAAGDLVVGAEEPAELMLAADDLAAGAEVGWRRSRVEAECGRRAHDGGGCGGGRRGWRRGAAAAVGRGAAAVRFGRNFGAGIEMGVRARRGGFRLSPVRCCLPSAISRALSLQFF